ncbi:MULTISPECIES: hypothetical protein [Bacillaceae]|uniref:hypothetical protein n=1 Tax=Bacillaceae TaxID=186817 RepID=UPI001187E9E7|nr:hypothetical protein [Bacillus sp. S3]QCJ41462.1 hypothetical protein FAY30_05875 [Bacillus sp. S3]
MFNKISIVASLLFFLYGTNVFATTQPEKSIQKNETVQAETFHDTKKTKITDPSFKDYVVPVSVGLLFVAGCGSYWLIYRRKHGA